MTTTTRPRTPGPAGPGSARGGGSAPGGATAYPSRARQGWTMESVGDWLRSPVAPHWLTRCPLLSR